MNLETHAHGPPLKLIVHACSMWIDKGYKTNRNWNIACCHLLYLQTETWISIWTKPKHDDSTVTSSRHFLTLPLTTLTRSWRSRSKYICRVCKRFSWCFASLPLMSCSQKPLMCTIIHNPSHNHPITCVRMQLRAFIQMVEHRKANRGYFYVLYIYR